MTTTENSTVVTDADTVDTAADTRGSADRYARFRTPETVVPAISFAVLASLYATMSVLGHRQLRTSGFDLGIFVQQIASYSQFRAPTSDLLGTGFNTLGDHFSPITALLGPVYRLFPHAETLLIAQAVLFALAVIPIARLAVQKFGTTVGVVIAAAFGLSWGVQAALNFDFHEMAFAMPLLAMSMVALVRHRWLPALAWALPLVFVKEDMGLTVIVIGALVALWTTGRTRILGALTAVWGLAWVVLAVKVIVPALSSDNSYDQGSKLPPLGEGIADTAHGLVAGDSRAATAFLLLAVTGFFALRSPLLLVAVPTVAWRFLSDNTNFWKPIYHYNAILMVIVFVALLDALARSHRHGQLTERGRKLIVAFVAAFAVIALPFLPMSRVVHAQEWTIDPQVTTVREISESIPAGDRVAASNNLVAQLVADHDVSVFPQRATDSTVPDWIVVNQQRPAGWPTDETGDRQAVDRALSTGYDVVYSVDGIEVLHRR
ncbi:DUF2079 domain-containing protein [Rhodococcus sp. ARC_M12]|uniref:DUF2079 domain-containing protein n=1 Tax=Rhodococcus sp. ARC_M12 TaxID=2928854 RepID=UPI001FB4E91C|nr:DUF2079 domain-containing protein [Rhodococcus sp. ARC_M12]MCJ0978604.1 DUF2079 domain-containing protein [Rhodococcus sp. ARC_M12]